MQKQKQQSSPGSEQAIVEKLNSWMGRLHRSDKGAVVSSVFNTLLMFDHDPELEGLLAYNEFRSEPLIMRPAPDPRERVSLPGPYPRPWDAADVGLILSYIQFIYSPRFTHSSLEEAMLTIATGNRFHPVQDWLLSLKWDGQPRIDSWLIHAFGCEDTAYHRAVGAKVLIAAVRRVRYPGCKFDYMMVLEGTQGIGKSETLRRLFGRDWFSDAIASDLAGKDAAMALLGVWGLEFSEIEHLIRSEVETIKAFLSRSVDRYRPPYGRAYIERPRQGILIGTTNKDDYLRDDTGNRRIWPVRCQTASPAWVEEVRDQLWAEAAKRETEGESEWLDDPYVNDEARDHQADRLSQDVWTDRIAEWLTDKAEVRLSDVLDQALLLTPSQQTHTTKLRCAGVMMQLGWEKRNLRRYGKQCKTWVKSTPDR